MRIILAIALIIIQSIAVISAAQTEKINVFSKAMKKDVAVRFITPDTLLHEQPASVVYLLHGHGGDEDTWYKVQPKLLDYADEENIIIVCPDAGVSWYWDSPINSNIRYETFVSSELVAYVDSNYPTIKSRNHRAISGLSMGGHGALWIGIRHKDTFAMAGSTSGGLDIRPFPNNWNMKDQLGEKESNENHWNEHTVINQLDSLKNGELSIIIDCGQSDFFFEVNNAFHQKLVEKKIDHDYIVRPGSHNGEYWSNAILYHMLFFCENFSLDISE